MTGKGFATLVERVLGAWPQTATWPPVVWSEWERGLADVEDEFVFAALRPLMRGEWPPRWPTIHAEALHCQRDRDFRLLLDAERDVRW